MLPFQNYVLHWMYCSCFLVVTEVIIYVILAFHKDFKKLYSTRFDEIAMLLHVGAYILLLVLVKDHHRQMITGGGQSTVQGIPTSESIAMEMIRRDDLAIPLVPGGDDEDVFDRSHGSDSSSGLCPDSPKTNGPLEALLDDDEQRLPLANMEESMTEVPDRYRGGATPLPPPDPKIEKRNESSSSSPV